MKTKQGLRRVLSRHTVYGSSCGTRIKYIPWSLNQRWLRLIYQNEGRIVSIVVIISVFLFFRIIVLGLYL
jgi:hypothetical protein